MKTYKKKDFVLNKPINESEVNELVDADGSPIGGGRTVTNNSEIETGPVYPPKNDDSGYEKGVSTTTDRAARYRQPRNWFSNLGYGGTPYSHGERGAIPIMAEDDNNIKQMVEDILNKKSNDNEVVRRYVDTDVNQNNIPDLQDLSNPAASNKTKEFLDVIKNNNLNGEQIAIMLNYIFTNLDVSKIPQNYKRLLLKKI